MWLDTGHRLPAGLLPVLVLVFLVEPPAAIPLHLVELVESPSMPFRTAHQIAPGAAIRCGAGLP